MDTIVVTANENLRAGEAVFAQRVDQRAQAALFLEQEMCNSWDVGFT